MPGPGASPPLLRAVLAALWLASCRGAQRPGCDNGKLHLHRDLPEDGSRGCPGSAWPESAWKHPAASRVYDPEPASQICMDESIVYAHAIPSSGAYRPVMAESGEYVYCPPQRWLNNLHHAATVLLHHPCAPRRERLFLSALARSCLTHYILSSHPHLKQRTPVALVSWGRTLELSTLASPDVCDWLETTAAARNTSAGAGGSRKYNLLLVRSAEERGGGPSAATETARQCCEKMLPSFLAAREAELRSHGGGRKRRGRRREIRAAFADGPSHVTSAGNGDKAASVPALNTDALPDDADLSPRTGGGLGSNISHPADAHGQALPPPAAERLWPGDELNHEGQSEAPPLSTGLNGRRSDRGDVPEERAGGHDKEGEREQEQTPGEGEGMGSESADPSESKLAFQPGFHHHSPTCDGCRTGERCECSGRPVAEAAPSPAKKGFPKSPRTDEAVWAAAALGSLLVLLALAVLHTRLYRHWRTTPSLYWYDPQQDYESVAEVIRRRLRIAKRRSKRSRRQQCVLLPVSSSSDEN